MADRWTAFYWTDYVRKTSGLTMVQHGAYLLLLSEYYANGPLSADKDVLFRLCRAFEKDEKKAVLFIVEKFFYLDPSDGGLYRNRRADEEISKSLEIKEQRTKAGQKGSQTRWQNRGKPIANAMANGIASASLTTTTTTTTQGQDQKRELRPFEIHPLQHADKVMEVLGMTKSFQNKTVIAEAIKAEAKHGGLDHNEVAQAITEAAMRDRENGIAIDKFYFEDSKWRLHDSKQSGVSATASRNRRNRDVIFNAATAGSSR